ncbi:MAG: methyltransferase domain-containing protein [Anaerolineae bacterium]|nr:methyltransferase domain-containing protein [Anaerolineae bacterium]
MSRQSIDFDRAADFYDQTRGFPPGVSEQAAALIAQAGNLTAQSRVLEVGVGTGRIALPLSAHTASLVGIDLSAAMLQRLRSKRRHEPVFVAQGDITRLPLASHSIDAAIAVHIFHLVAGYEMALSEVARVLKPGGVLIHAWTEHDKADALTEVWRQATGRQQAPEIGMRMDQRLTAMEENGWQSVGEAHELAYSVQRTPNEHLESLRKRIWSHTWRMSDTQIEDALSTLQNYIDTHFDDPNIPQPVNSTFVVRIYQPPLQT